MSSPCHIELILSEKEEPVRKEVIFNKFFAAENNFLSKNSTWLNMDWNNNFFPQASPTDKTSDVLGS